MNKKTNLRSCCSP